MRIDSMIVASEPPVETEVEVSLVDCDVHVEPRSFDEIVTYMDEPWRSRAIAPRLPAGRATYRPLGDGKRSDSYPDVGVPGSDLELLGEQLFRETATDYAIALPGVRGFSVDPELNAALATAINRWLAETWLGAYNDEGRFFGSITVSVDDPAAASREIERWAGHPCFRQILIGHYGEMPYGHPRYEQIWATAAAHGLPVAMHFRSAGNEPLGWTPAGPFQHYVDYHSLAIPMAYTAHLASWICAGTFERHPNFRIVFVEGGFLWYRPVIARLSEHWSQTACELRVSERTPLDLVYDHVRWTTQPIEEAERTRDVATLLDTAEAERVLMFSSDYPHYDYDLPARALPPQLDASAKRRILAGNALELYGLPASRSRDRFDRTASAA
jgi:predicted TIM-barrel fold metal-dependent hydrolase